MRPCTHAPQPLIEFLHSVIGLDREDDSGSQLGALWQLTRGDICILLCFSVLQGIPVAFVRIMANPSIYKCGANVVNGEWVKQKTSNAKYSKNSRSTMLG